MKPNERTKDLFDQYEDTDGHGICSMRDPPSALNEVCRDFHDKIMELK